MAYDTSIGSRRAQVRRKGKYVNESFLRCKTLKNGALEVERRIDRSEAVLAGRAYKTKTFDLVRLHRDDIREVGKQIGRSKAASLALLERRLRRLRLPELDRERLIQFGKGRASEGAGPVTLGMDLGYIKTILSHAAAVHGVIVTIELFNLARVALGRLGLVGKEDERDRRPTQDELNRLVASFDANPRQQIPMGRIIRFAVATAMRQSEKGALRIWALHRGSLPRCSPIRRRPNCAGRRLACLICFQVSPCFSLV